MARDSAEGAHRLYDFHQHWIREALPAGSSLLSEGASIWTPRRLEELVHHFIGQPDLTKDKLYLDKLRGQLEGASPEAVQLMAELHVVHFVPIWTGALSAAKKKADVEAILSWMPTPARLPPEVLAVLEPGIVNPGTWVFTRRDTQIAWLILFSQSWLRLAEDRRRELLSDPWAFKAFVVGVDSPSADGAKLAMLHFTFPDHFEPIVTNQHKDAIAARFAEFAGPDPDVDRRLLEIRRALTPTHGEGYDYYRSGLERRWLKPKKAWQPFLDWIERLRAVPDFDELERDYKLRLAEVVGKARNAVLAADPAWADLVKAAFTKGGNNLTQWTTHDRFLGWMKEDPQAVREALMRLWGAGTVADRFAAFTAAVPERVLHTRGSRLNIASYLLMGEDPFRLPPIKISRIRRAARLVGWEEPKNSDADAFGWVIAFFEEIHHEGTRWRVPLRDPLDAQSAVWMLTSIEEPPRGWSREWWEEFQAYRSSAPEPVGPDDPSDDFGEPEADTGDTHSTVDHIAEAARDLHVDRSFLDEIVQLLDDKGQVVFYGPPGTGKTYLALRLARAIAEGDETRVSLVQFHPATSYEDFIEGLRPRLTPQGQVTYEVVAGPLVRIAEAARRNPSRRHVLVVDEINRANLPKVFGELLFLLEYRRERAMLIHRSQEPFGLPENLWIIGTMNTADRSIALIDAAMRRRFHFVPFFPHEGAMRDLLRRWLREHGGRDAVARLLDAVNAELREDLGEHLLIGPSHFMRTDLSDAALERIWTYNVFPLIEEQYWGDRAAVDRWRWTSVRQRFAPAIDGIADDESVAAPPTNGSGRSDGE